MFKSLSIIGALTIGLFFTANAQIDSTLYNLGRISLKKGFTQNITIKGSDLERYQFSDLADAINVWLYGTYSNSSSLIYVIDGNIITDVNAYSIYDVESVTLVQNVLAQVSGASPGQQTVLIKLKTGGPGKQGIEAAGQTSIVNRRNANSTPGTKTTTNFYNQYYISGYKNLKNVDFGMSADYQRDVSPALTSGNLKVVYPFHFDRFKLNAYGNANLWKGTRLSARVNYTPQDNNVQLIYNYNSSASTQNQYVENVNNNTTQHLFNTSISLNSNVLPGLHNMLSAAYDHYNYFERDSVDIRYNATNNGGQPFVQYFKSGYYDKSFTFSLRDNLVYKITIGDFTIEPSVSFSYRNAKDSASNSNEQVSVYNNGNPAVNQASGSSLWSQYKAYLLTSSMNIYYKDVFNIQGGIISNITPKKYSGSIKERLPLFLSIMLDIGKLSGIADFHFQLFGSFSRQNPILNENYQTIAGFQVAGSSKVYYLKTAGGTPYPSQGNIFYNYTAFYQSTNYQAGAVVGFCKNLKFNYSFEYGYNESSTAQNNAIAAYKFITNRVGLNYNYNSKEFNWISGLNIAQSMLTITKNSYYPYNFNTGTFSAGHRYSGGFTNRFACNNLFAGMDILYQLGARPYTLTDPAQLNTNYVAPLSNDSFSLQNLYFGSKIKVYHLKYAEIYINGRNILQNKSSNITDDRRFFGVGFKASL